MGRASFLWALAGSIGLHALTAYSLWPQTPLRPAHPNTLLVHAQILPVHENIGTAVQPPPISKSPPIPLHPVTPVSAGDSHLPPHMAEIAVEPEPVPLVEQGGYFPINEVDEPATPLGDWLVDTEVLPHGYTLRLVVLVWISASGNIDKWELDSLSGNKAYALKALTDLDRTSVNPAMRNNIAVPSYRRLEMVITHE